MKKGKTQSDKRRELSIEQLKTIELLVKGQSVQTVAESVGVSSQVIYDWRAHDLFFITELNLQRSRSWSEAQERLRSLANEAIDVLKGQLGSNDPKVAQSAAKVILQSSRLLGDSDLPSIGPTTPKGVIMNRLRDDAREELLAKTDPIDIMHMEFYGIDKEAEKLARERMKGALEEEGI